MAAVPERPQTAGIGIVERDLSQHLEGMRAGFPRVGINAMRDFQAVDIGVMLHLAANRVTDWLAKETENTENEKNHRERRPIAELANMPARAEAAQHPA